MDRSLVHFFLFANFIVAIVYFLRKKNEVPFFLAVFNLMVEYRILALENGTSTFIFYDYGIDFIFDMQYAYIASGLITLGTTIMLYSYIAFFKTPEKTIRDNDQLLSAFIDKNKTKIIVGLCFFTLLNIVLSGSDAGSYSLLIKIGNTSFIILLFLVVIYGSKISGFVKLIYGLIFCFLAYLTYSTAIRFQFLGWIIPIGYFLVRNVKPGKKLVLAFSGIFVILIVFSLAGAMRQVSLSGLTVEQMYDLSIDRMLMADDVNFIDGFMMLYQVYPKLLDYDYGLQHIAIFLRPIPRSLWPGKPLASWVRNYQAKYNNGVVLESAGFSPTIWGVFYSEGGIVGIIIFSVFWGWLLGVLYRKFSSFKSDLSYLLVGIMIACLIPVFRSGDMAGDFAIVLMSFWPFIVFVRYYKKFVERELKLERLKTLAVK
ncbi:O-antigen polymerase [Mucilaginibacter sp. CSA2-8R]|uniref:O-antigen polymerase n=1 Tax=Mucilaginibacter sp. CSA2-8R TaxID=3141542 RepID=UPI00315CAA8C